VLELLAPVANWLFEDVRKAAGMAVVRHGNTTLGINAGNLNDTTFLLESQVDELLLFHLGRGEVPVGVRRRVLTDDYRVFSWPFDQWVRNMAEQVSTAEVDRQPVPWHAAIVNIDDSTAPGRHFFVVRRAPCVISHAASKPSPRVPCCCSPSLTCRPRAPCLMRQVAWHIRPRAAHERAESWERLHTTPPSGRAPYFPYNAPAVGQKRGGAPPPPLAGKQPRGGGGKEGGGGKGGRGGGGRGGGSAAAAAPKEEAAATAGGGAAQRRAGAERQGVAAAAARPEAPAPAPAPARRAAGAPPMRRGRGGRARRRPPMSRKTSRNLPRCCRRCMQSAACLRS